MSKDINYLIRLRQFESVYQARKYIDHQGNITYRLYDKAALKKRKFPKRQFTDLVSLWFDSETRKTNLSVEKNPLQIFMLLEDFTGHLGGSGRCQFWNEQNNETIVVTMFYS